MELLAHELAHVEQQLPGEQPSGRHTSSAARQAGRTVIRRRFQPAAALSEAHLRNRDDWGALVGAAIPAGTGVFVDDDPAQHVVQQRRVRKNVTWVPAVNVDPAQPAAATGTYPALVEILDVKLIESDLHEHGLGVMMVKFRKPIGGAGMFANQTIVEAVIKPKTRVSKRRCSARSPRALPVRPTNLPVSPAASSSARSTWRSQTSLRTVPNRCGRRWSNGSGQEQRNDGERGHHHQRRWGAGCDPGVPRIPSGDEVGQPPSGSSIPSVRAPHRQVRSPPLAPDTCRWGSCQSIHQPVRSAITSPPVSENTQLAPAPPTGTMAPLADA